MTGRTASLLNQADTPLILFVAFLAYHCVLPLQATPSSHSAKNVYLD